MLTTDIFMVVYKNILTHQYTAKYCSLKFKSSVIILTLNFNNVIIVFIFLYQRMFVGPIWTHLKYSHETTTLTLLRLVAKVACKVLNHKPVAIISKPQCQSMVVDILNVFLDWIWMLQSGVGLDIFSIDWLWLERIVFVVEFEDFCDLWKLRTN